MKMLAFDLGASSGKIFQGVFDGRTIALRDIHRFQNETVAVRGDLYWDILEIFRNLKVGISKAFQSESKIDSIGLDSFSNDFGLLDRNGHLVTQVYCYRDGRTRRNEEKIYAWLSKQQIHNLTGNQNALFGTLMQLASMRLEEQSYLLDEAGSLLFVPDLLAYFLTGEIHAEYTIASVSQMMDYRTGAWSPEILAAFGIPERILPGIVPPGTRVGKVVEPVSGRAKNSLEVIAACEHDTGSAFLAAPYGDRSIIVSSGTWSLVGVEPGGPIVNDATFRCNIANEGGYPGHHRLLKNVMGHWIIQECQRSYREQGMDFSTDQFMSLAAQEPPFQYMIDPDDGRFFSPGGMPGKVCDYCREKGQGSPETPGQVLRCVVESLAFKYRRVIEELENVVGKAYPEINIVGGGSKNKLLNQLVANATGRRVFAGPEEATSLGNILVQLLGFNEVGSVEQAREIIQSSFPVTIYEPQDRPAWEARYQEYIDCLNSPLTS